MIFPNIKQGMRHAGAATAMFLAAACNSASAPVSAPAADPATAKAFDSLAENAAAPGVAAGLYENGALVGTLSWGAADLETGKLMDPGAAFEIASLSKHMTAVAVLKLEAGGKLSRTDAIGDHVAGLPESWRPITLHQLLSHTGGVPDYEAVVGFGFYETGAGAEDVLASVREMPLDFEPGASFHYSNTGYYLLSLAIENASGMSFARYIEEAIFTPADMTQSRVGGSGRRGMAAGYKPAGEGFAPVGPIRAETTLGAGAVVSTLADWGKWRTALRAGALLPRGLADETVSPSALADGSSVNYGYGMIIDQFRGEPRLMHTGQSGGFVSRWEYYPETGRGVMVFANSGEGKLGAVAKGLALSFVPGLDYGALEPVASADASETAFALEALRQAVLGGGATDHLAEGMKAFAVSEDYAPLRAALSPSVATVSDFVLIKAHKVGDRGAVRRVYRARSDEGTLYWELTFVDGELSGLNWEDS